ncbi:MAG: type II toxin-antitoxin system RelE/ParE family toxin [Burkholderiaceae bacterium]|nr:type II toxin-antitoxin system RelE/ParE family toxin [Burkholderiaceae bacterium]MCD8515953.1 type II toxin-antitoxin system RelE/ParE family toxin [Burkholderiaceae bacterium]MCD8536997.1 type II toxin-antitoxin system RelE/ParE family toxin [Burkholderiaceae bacterium]MCD8564736.1 type II toxin-antitoxin system RelE/ParE family toxin [Burkholderiaceae bacterium]
MSVRVQAAASLRIDEIYQYTQHQWGKRQADKYIKGLFAAFDRIASRGVLSKPVPAEFGVSGFFFRYERHIVYWRYLSGGDIGIVSILHERMHQIDRFADDFGSGPT